MERKSAVADQCQRQQSLMQFCEREKLSKGKKIQKMPQNECGDTRPESPRGFGLYRLQNQSVAGQMARESRSMIYSTVTAVP